MELREVMKKRESVRQFKSAPVEKEKLLAVLEAGRLAPTAKNLQPQIVYVVQSAEGLEKIDTASPCRYGAPLVLMVCGDKNAVWQKSTDYTTLDVDCSIVTTHMMLEACEQGLGSVWVGMFDGAKLSELFDLPENQVPVCLLPLGYTADEYPGSRNRGNRKPLEDTVRYL